MEKEFQEAEYQHYKNFLLRVNEYDYFDKLILCIEKLKELTYETEKQD